MGMKPALAWRKTSLADHKLSCLGSSGARVLAKKKEEAVHSIQSSYAPAVTVTDVELKLGEELLRFEKTVRAVRGRPKLPPPPGERTSCPARIVSSCPPPPPPALSLPGGMCARQAEARPTASERAPRSGAVLGGSPPTQLTNQPRAKERHRRPPSTLSKRRRRADRTRHHHFGGPQGMRLCRGPAGMRDPRARLCAKARVSVGGAGDSCRCCSAALTWAPARWAGAGLGLGMLCGQCPFPSTSRRRLCTSGRRAQRQSRPGSTNRSTWVEPTPRKVRAPRRAAPGLGAIFQG